MSYTPLKYYFDERLARRLAELLVRVYPDFPVDDFILSVVDRVGDHELKARVAILAEELRNHLPPDYLDALPILLQILGPENPSETGMFTEGYWLMPVAYFVEVYGLDHLEESLHAIGEITKRNTGEYAIRPYLVKYPDETIARMTKWADHDNFHVRRLASEGMRPRLPWAKKLDAFIADPSPILPILNKLHDDESKFVRKSVGNNVNDILKDNYEVGMALLRSWAEAPSANTRWVIKHALRNQLKSGNKEARKLIDQVFS